jgi:hypothetical protein
VIAVELVLFITVFVKLLPDPPLVFTRLRIFPLGALKFIIRSWSFVCVIFNVTLIPVTIAPAGIPETAIVFVAPTALLSGIATLTAPEAYVDVSEFDAANDWMALTQIVALEGVIVIAPVAPVTSCVLEAVTAPQDPPLVVSVRVAVPVNPTGGVHVAFNVVAPGVNVPPDGVDQVPPVAEPPTEPPKGAEEPVPQIGLKAAPALAVATAFTVIRPSNEVAVPLEFVNTALYE